MPTQLWRPITGQGLERCELETTASGYRIAGTALRATEDEPYEIRYSILTDPDWVVSTVGAHVQGPGNDRRLALASDGKGAWSVTEAPVVELSGAIDVELSWTPSAHTVAIKRLDLEVGEAADTTVVAVGFPSHDIERKTHRYERIALRRYRFSAGAYQTDLEVDEHGLIVTQPGRWMSVLAH
jgi:hypothetical protein